MRELPSQNFSLSPEGKETSLVSENLTICEDCS